MLKKKVYLRIFFILILSVLCGMSYFYLHDKNIIEVNAKFLNFYVKHKLAKVFPDSEISIGSTTLTWQNKNENFVLSSQDVVIKNTQFGVDITIPQFLLYSKVGILFLWGNYDFSYIDIPKVHVKFYDLDKKIDLSFVENPIKVLKDALFGIMNLNIPILVNNAVLSKSGKKDLEIKQLSVRMNKEYDKNVIDFNIDNDSSFLNMKAYEYYKGVMSFEVTYGNFSTELLGYLGNLGAQLSLYNDLKLSGSAMLRISEDEKITYGNIDIQNLVGDIPCNSVKKCHVHDFKTKLIYQNSVLFLKNFSLLLDQSAVSGMGVVDNEYVNLNFDIDSISPEKLCQYWSVDLYPDLNKWYCSNVKLGKINNVKFQIKGQRGNNPVYDDVSNYKIDAEVKNVTIAFHDSFDPVKIVSGKLSLLNDNFVMTSNNLDFKGMVIGNANLKIENLNDANAVMEISGSSVGDVRQLYNAVDKKEFILLNSDKMFGNSNTEFSFKIFNLLNDKPSDYTSDIHARIDSFKTSGILDTFNVDDAEVDITLHNSDVSLNSHGSMNGYPMSLKMIRSLEGHYKTHYEFTGYISEKNMRELGLIKYTNYSGIVKANLQWDSDNLGTVIGGDVDLSQLHFKIHDVTRDSLPAVLKFSAMFKDRDEIKISDAKILGDKIDIELNGKVGSTIELFLDKVKLWDTDVKAEFKLDKDLFKMKVIGASLNLSSANFSEIMKSESKVKETTIDINVDNVIMKNKVMAYNVNFALDSYEGKYNAIKLTGNFADDSNFYVEYSPIGLQINTDNAGELLRATDILKTINKGTLSFYMYPIKRNDTTYGMFSLTDFHIVNASILAQILTLSSLKGVVNTLNGKGIYFNRLNVPFTYKDDIMNITESWMEGSELGISLGGEVNLNTKIFDIKGQIVPAYVINKIIWQTPILGKLLTGGQSRGVIAIDYKVKGTDKNHDLSVNFMSILTPNLLKRVLKIFDTKLVKKDKDKQELVQSKSA
ncbi:AsmA-like C-terminal domain-containing protein [Ehrlichia ruminantium]|nr:AsmA-like C-terminal domain-containing protein [Ehrlichia ruminantium]